MEGFATDFITLDCRGLKKSEGQPLLSLAQHVQSEATGFLSDVIGTGIGLHPDHATRGGAKAVWVTQFTVAAAILPPLSAVIT
mgnify:FL=1